MTAANLRIAGQAGTVEGATPEMAALRYRIVKLQEALDLAAHRLQEEGAPLHMVDDARRVLVGAYE